MSSGEGLAEALAAARGCTLCADILPHAPNPVLMAGEAARILVVGQAPGRRVHATGWPWNDPSGDRLRSWLGVDRATFYDPQRFAIVPVGLCYPGTDARGADRPPPKICAPTWQPRLRAALPKLDLILAIGSHAQAYELGRRRSRSMKETVAAYRDHLARGVFPLPHPSWRNTRWLQQNPWFEAEVVPALQARVAARL